MLLVAGYSSRILGLLGPHGSLETLRFPPRLWEPRGFLMDMLLKASPKP